MPEKTERELARTNIAENRKAHRVELVRAPHRTARDDGARIVSRIRIGDPGTEKPPSRERSVLPVLQEAEAARRHADGGMPTPSPG